MNKNFNILLVVCISLFFCKYTQAQDYYNNFAKPIVTQKGQFVYNELPPIKTEAGVLYFLDRNVGASSLDLETSDTWGDLYQWGRETDGHEKRYSDTTLLCANSQRTNHNLFIVDQKKSNDWLINSEDNLWQGSKGENNPCPCGYRLPTQKEWRAVLNLGYDIKSTSTGYHYLSIANGQLILPCGGLRSAYTGHFIHIGTRGYYWASDTITKGTSGCIDFNKQELTTNVSIFGFRGFGRSVRCVRSE
ncbi:MAG TPA: hypothetical protein GX005_08120 [Bacteroidales bacterium]|nr:hypothetical protein [Bacteroidales bacterium]